MINIKIWWIFLCRVLILGCNSLCFPYQIGLWNIHIKIKYTLCILYPLSVDGQKNQYLQFVLNLFTFTSFHKWSLTNFFWMCMFITRIQIIISSLLLFQFLYLYSPVRRIFPSMKMLVNVLSKYCSLFLYIWLFFPYRLWIVKIIKKMKISLPLH
jgi:hypothetical protein